jgi:beta-ribofuranosylaminobenzene 5'-phosphate synthase
MSPRSETTAIRVVAPARLHLGFLDLAGGLGRRYGSIGLAVDEPATALTVIRAAAFNAAGEEKSRALGLLQRYINHFDLPGSYRVDVERAIPAHAGLGSGTQLALAIGVAVMRLAGRTPDARSLGELVDRGARSAIGMASFTDGGFIIDGGRGEADRAPPVIVRTPFPDAWRGLLVLDRNAVGVHGDRETKAFSALREFPETTAAHLCHLTLLRLLPGLVERDLPAFGAALTEIQAVVGSHFATEQGGGIWSSPSVGRLVARMGEAGAVGLGQSSWGPTGFAFVENQDAANKHFHTLGEEARSLGLEIVIVRGRNSGATITTAE